jgi:hypothetical protein
MWQASSPTGTLHIDLRELLSPPEPTMFLEAPPLEQSVLIEYKESLPLSTWPHPVTFIQMGSTPEIESRLSLIETRITALETQLADLKAALPKEKIVMLKTMTRDQAKIEIRALFDQGQPIFYSDIVELLGIDLPLVVEICDELMAAGEIRDGGN